MALRQTNYSRLLAYSSIAHIGYGVLAVSTGSETAVAAGLFHILVHAIMKSGLFFLGPGVHQSGSGDDSSGTVLFPRRYKWLYATVYCVLAMSMIGIPPVLGFTSKWHTVLETARAGSQIGAVLVAVGGAIALVYYLRFGLQLSSPVARDNAPETSRDAGWVLPALAALLVFALAFFSDSLIGLCVQAVDQLTGAVW
jgi:NADH:ubiquinone oxidoreductase subunit 2 (subunit N)